jgi:hypothetical protein
VYPHCTRRNVEHACGVEGDYLHWRACITNPPIIQAVLLPSATCAVRKAQGRKGCSAARYTSRLRLRIYNLAATLLRGTPSSEFQTLAIAMTMLKLAAVLAASWISAAQVQSLLLPPARDLSSTSAAANQAPMIQTPIAINSPLQNSRTKDTSKELSKVQIFGCPTIQSV